MQDETYFWQVERYSQGDVRVLGTYASLDEAKLAVMRYVSTDPRVLRWECLAEDAWRLVEGDGAFTCYTVERWYRPAGAAEARRG